MSCHRIAAAGKDLSPLDKVPSAASGALQERSTGIERASEESPLEAVIRVEFPVFFHVVLEVAVPSQDVRSDWFSSERLPSSCWIKFRFFLLCEPDLFNGSLTVACPVLPQVLICEVHLVTCFLLLVLLN